MQYLEYLFTDIESTIDAAETEQEALNIADQLKAYEALLTSFRLLIETQTPGNDMINALDNDLEHFEVWASDLAISAEAAAKEIREAAEDQEKYGTYEEQHRQRMGDVL